MVNGKIRLIFASKLSQKWSPKQISGWLSTIFADEESLHASHETPYKRVFVRSRAVLKKEIQTHLRTQRLFLQSRTNNTKVNARGGIIEAAPIADRPPEVENWGLLQIIGKAI